MKQLTKYLLVTSIITIILFVFLTIVQAIFKNDVSDPADPLVFIIFILPFIIIFISGFYQFRNPSGKGYLKSLLIPLLFMIISIVAILVYIKVANFSGEENMIFGIWIFSVIITFIAIAVINLIILGIKSIKNK